MLYIVTLFLFVLSAVARTDAQIDAEFAAFKTQFGKTYESAAVEAFRRNVFRASLERADAANAKRASADAATFGVTMFSDLTPDEFRQQFLLPTPVKPSYEGAGVWNASQAVDAPAATVNWYTKGACTPVYNQAQCGSCWAFSATEAIESACYLAGQPMVSLSMQQIVSCDQQSDGCNGGDPTNAYNYVVSAGGIESFQDYPYSSGGGNTGYCQFQSSDIVRKISGWNYVTQSQDESQMKQFVSSTGPPSICVDAASWQDYTGGVMTSDQCGTSLDHCVQLVGYDDSASTPYWIVRNSWTTSWGVGGFIYLQYGQDTCGVAQEVTWPTC